MKLPTKQVTSVFCRHIRKRTEIVKVSGKKAILEIGNDAWPFPIPIVKKPEDGWFFDVRQGKEELLNRRIGKNELSTIQVCLAYIDAQREYASKDRNGDGVLEYAQKFLSDPGTKDGLYWETEEGEEQSPLGPLIGEAKKEGYKKKSGNEPTPYHGYYLQDPEGPGQERAPRRIRLCHQRQNGRRVCHGRLSRSVRIIGNQDFHRKPGWRRIREKTSGKDRSPSHRE